MPALPKRSTPPADLVGGEGASEAQTNYLRSLMSERQLPKDEAVELMATLKNETLTKRSASRWIEKLQSLPRAREAAKFGGWEDVPDGRYALDDPDDELNPVKFYRVKTGGDANPRWAGFRFVTIYSSDEEWPVRGARRDIVLNAIAEDPLAAAQQFAKEERRCSICYRRLTRRISRALGIGPVCAGKVGWYSDEEINDKREELRLAGFDPDEDVGDE